MSGSPVTQQRLRDGAEAKNLSEPATEAEMRAQLEQLGDAIAALQSLDDLGTPEANEQAWNDMLALQSRYASIQQRLRELERGS